MARTRDTINNLGLTQSELKVLLYGILCPSTEGSRTAVDFDKLATELGYTSSSAKVMYGNARRKLIRATGITPSSGASTGRATPATSGASTSPASSLPAPSGAAVGPTGPDTSEDEEED